MPSKLQIVNMLILFSIPTKPMNAVMELFLISLQSDDVRRERFHKNMSSIGLNYQLIDAVDARQWSQEECDRHLSKPAIAFNMAHYPIAGSIGCYLSHLKAFEALIDSGAESAVIFEDDIIVSPDFATHMDCLEQAARAFDIIWLCDRRPNRPAPLVGTSKTGLEFRFKRFANIGTTGYVINRRAAKHMLDHHRLFGVEIDLLLNKWWDTGFLTATTYPDLLHDTEGASSIGYKNIKSFKNPLYRIARMLNNGRMSLLKRWRFASHYAKMKHSYQKVTK